MLWVDGSFWFETGATTRKGRNRAWHSRLNTAPRRPVGLRGGVYRITTSAATAIATVEPGGATRWTA